MTTRAGQFLTIGPAISLLAGPVRAPRSPSPFRWFRRLQVSPVGQYLSVPVVNYGPSLAAKELHGSRVVGVLGPSADSVSWVFKYRPYAPFLRCPTPRQHLRRQESTIASHLGHRQLLRWVVGVVLQESAIARHRVPEPRLDESLTGARPICRHRRTSAHRRG
jgi:hypothetical protein